MLRRDVEIYFHFHFSKINNCLLFFYIPNLTLQDILASGITWKDLCDYLRDDQIVWTAPDV
jgi:hypothetical protein